jgi:Fic family protein
VMETVFAHWNEIALTENPIRQLHRDLLRHSPKDERHRGSYKTLRNDVAAFDADRTEVGIVFETATPFDTPRLMTGLVTWANHAFETEAQHPLIIIAVFIVSFLAIHPFQDGNGRLSRVLTTLLLLRRGYAYVPYASLESVVESSKERYYMALRQTQGTIKAANPDWAPWLEYFLGALAEQKLRLEKKIQREHLLFGDLPELSIKILELCKERGRVTVSAIQRVTGANRNTVKDHVAALTKNGHLCRHGAGRGAWYSPG